MTEAFVLSLRDNIDLAFILIGAAILIIEIAEALFKGEHKGRTFAEMAVSASTQLPYLVVETFILGGAYVLFYILSDTFVTWQLPITWWTLVLVLIAADFTYYWEHRIAHEVRILWTQHAVHHSSRDFNMVTGVRFGPLEGVWGALAHLPLVFLGFPPEIIFFGIVIVLAYQTWIHTELIGSLGVLDRFMNTPANHRVHHGSDDKYLDRNYGGITVIWDRLFGTFQAEEETPVYGLKRDFDSRNPIKVWFSEWPGLFADLRQAKSVREVFGYLFKGPGWAPKD